MQPPKSEDVDGLKMLEDALAPDKRMTAFVTVDKNGVKPAELRQRHNEISSFTLNPYVPIDIRNHFDTARNLYLYAWFVYRFHAVAELHVLGSLEFALRERLGKTDQKSGLKKLLTVALDKGLISNDRFSCLISWATQRARSRYRVEQLAAMIQAGKHEMMLDESKAQVSAQDYIHDWIGDFIAALPSIRNSYAHGSHLLDPNVLSTFEIVTELINQLFSTEDV